MAWDRSWLEHRAVKWLGCAALDVFQPGLACFFSDDGPNSTQLHSALCCFSSIERFGDVLYSSRSWNQVTMKGSQYSETCRSFGGSFVFMSL